MEECWKLMVVAVLCLYRLPIWGFAAEQQLRFGKHGKFKILQVADMHFADGKTTPCLNVLPGQFASCSDLNTTAFVRRMILAENPHLIVFTGTRNFPPKNKMQQQQFKYSQQQQVKYPQQQSFRYPTRGPNQKFHSNSPTQPRQNSPQNFQQQPMGSSNFSNNNSRVPCQICGKTSHQALEALDCFHRMDYSYQGRHPPTQLAAMVAQTNTTFEDQEWFADSGTNAHITNELENLTTQQPFENNETVAVGNGSGLTIDNSGQPYQGNPPSRQE